MSVVARGIVRGGAAGSKKVINIDISISFYNNIYIPPDFEEP